MSVISVFEQRLADLVVAQSPATAVERARLKAFVAVRLGFPPFSCSQRRLAARGGAAAGVAMRRFRLSARAARRSVRPLSRGFGLDFAQMLLGRQVVGFAGALSHAALIFGARFRRAPAGGPRSGRLGRRRLLIATCVAAFAIGALALNSSPARAAAAPTPRRRRMLAAIVGYACALGWAMAYANAVASFGERRETLRHEALAQTIGDLVVRPGSRRLGGPRQQRGL